VKSSFGSALATLATLTALAACGGAAPRPPTGGAREPLPGPAASPTVGEARSPADRTPRGRLQGTWEIVRYQSKNRIPDEAMPLMGELFDSLRLRFSGDRVVVTAGRFSEASDFAVQAGPGGELRLSVRGGMFDGALLRFIDERHVELVDDGKAWPGLSVLEREK
jgi:hypothetical protein